MKPEIQKRIEQIQKGVVPEGYKKTKVGIVPSEWDKYKFVNLFNSISELTDDTETYPLHSLTIEKGVIPKSERYERGFLILKTEDTYKIVRENQFVYNPMNLRFGAIARYKGRFPVSVSGYYDIFFCKNRKYVIFMDFFLKSDKMINFYNRMATGSLIEKQRVHFSQFLDFELPLPSINECEKIAGILSIWDKVIELKEQLIAGKKQLKKWLMQNLLTGKKRLPGFIDEWQEVQLGDICTINDNVLSENTQSDFKFWYIDLSSVDRGKIIYPTLAVKFEELPSRARRLFKKDDILMSTVRPYLLGFAYIDKEYDYYVCSTGFAVVRAKEGVCSKFVYHTLFSNGVIRQMNQCLMGTNYPALNNDDVYQLYFELPPLPEQIAIAKILSIADREIDLHEKQLEELKKQKKALMQLLLTGTVRVITQEVS